MSAVRGEDETKELNDIIKSLGEPGKESQRWKQTDGNFWNIVFHLYSDVWSKVSGNLVVFRPYGSVAEDLKSDEPDDVGDVDIMVFPESDNLLIHKELIEYLPEHPAHVRIKGVDHPVFKFCCVKDTSYLSTSAVKNSHELIYGDLDDALPALFRSMSRKSRSSPHLFTSDFKDASNSPALTVDVTLPPEDINSASSHSSAREWPENSEQLQNKMMTTHLTEVNEDIEKGRKKKQGGTTSCIQTEFKEEKQTLALKEDVASRVVQGPEEDKEDETTNGAKAVEYLYEHLFRKGYTNSKEDPCSEQNETEEVQSRKHHLTAGIDYVPALKCSGWPEVAQDWIMRERKWPSPQTVGKIIHEGFHLVAKPPKKGGNPDCDFRISFSHAEYLLSQEMNDVHRQCYRCLKKYHRAYLSTDPKGLVTFHLKNILLQTIEETGADMWTDSNRAECLMKLLGNLLEALTKRHLSHFFVRSYNLFSIDYIEDPEILESLAGTVKRIMENPVQFAKELIQNLQCEETKVSGNELTSSTKHATVSRGHAHGGTKQTAAEAGSDETQNKQKEVDHQGNSPFTSYRYHELKSIFLAIGKELTDIAFNDHAEGRSIETLDPLESSIVHDFKHIAMEAHFDVEDFSRMLDINWNTVYLKVLLSTEPNMRCRMLDGLKSVAELWKWLLKEGGIGKENNETVLSRMLDFTAEDAFDLSHVLPAGAGTQLIQMITGNNRLESRTAQPQDVVTDDIPLD